jgi:uncharacterized membrane protein
MERKRHKSGRVSILSESWIWESVSSERKKRKGLDKMNNSRYNEGAD